VIPTQQLRAAVLREYDHYTERKQSGPCGAVAVALSRLGLGSIVQLTALSEEVRPDCDLEDEHDGHGFSHFAVMTPDNEILDVSLPPDFNLIGYTDVWSRDEDDMELGCLWDEDDYAFWLGVLAPIVQGVTA
jgi:hypothetical protein